MFGAMTHEIELFSKLIGEQLTQNTLLYRSQPRHQTDQDMLPE
jgi:hypothetical protein